MPAKIKQLGISLKGYYLFPNFQLSYNNDVSPDLQYISESHGGGKLSALSSPNTK